jgi:hypothetical protein
MNNDSASHNKKLAFFKLGLFLLGMETLPFFTAEENFCFFTYLCMLCMPTQCMPKLYDKIIFYQFVHIQAMQSRFYVGINTSMSTDAIS